MRCLRLWLALVIAVALLPLATPTAYAEEGRKTHTVQEGETLSAIAKKYKVTVANLVELNDLPSSSAIPVGQELKIGGWQEILADNPPITKDSPWWGRVIVGEIPIRPVPKAQGYLDDPERPSLDTALYRGDSVQVVKTVKGQELIRGNDKWYKIEAEEEQYVYSAYVKPKELPAIPPVAKEETREKWIAVFLKEQLVVAYEDDKVVYATLTASGKIYPTPRGYFFINGRWRPDYRRMVGGREGTSEYYDLPDVRYVSYFTDEGHALHGTYWHHRFGQPMSHGCVNLTNYDAKFIYEWAPSGTLVVVI